jgi:hypothetical protein
MKVVHLKSSLKSFDEGIFNLGLPSFWNFPSFRIPKITRYGKGFVPTLNWKSGAAVGAGILSTFR